ncbi:hypothetical protein FB192DRAFT_1473945 [Mucor lusitanicus]|uniref:Peptidase C19 ubiquitin carboxyl-terminal hydrolase domain-containing protein n=1 Tax=Mucor circinelloides f. lusitanicus TaxID=29924 RepID=A0A8H4BG09_MUCCL|nr:hypothetical protein FB192DRAFT_1473945 [Mucor lusitanicus]
MDGEDDFAFVAYPQELVTLALTTGAGGLNSQQDASECLIVVCKAYVHHMCLKTTCTSGSTHKHVDTQHMVAEGARDAQLRNELLDNFAVFTLGASTPSTLAQKLGSWLKNNRLVLGGAAGSNVPHAVVDLPLQINMQRYYTEHLHPYTPNFMYTLHTVIYPNGTDISGHYWSYILDHTTNQWWEFEDQKVQPVEKNTVLHCSKSPDAHTLAEPLIMDEFQN